MEEINENLAREAVRMNSFNEYIEGSAIKSYESKCDEVRSLAEKRKTAIPEEHRDELDKMVATYCKRLANWINRENACKASCPSILISGAGNFPVRKKEKQNARHDNLMHEYINEIEAIIEKIKYFGYGGFPIKSGDKNAIQQLEEKIAIAEEKQHIMKLRNAYYRKNKTLKGCEGVDDSAAAQFDKEIEKEPSSYKIPYQSFVLTNNNANIKRLRQRLEELIKEKSTDGLEYDTEGLCLKVVENKEIMRLQIIFDDKPSKEIRNLLKSHSFKWAPSQNAWQRQLTNNARFSLKHVLKKLKETKSHEENY